MRERGRERQAKGRDAEVQEQAVSRRERVSFVGGDLPGRPTRNLDTAFSIARYQGTAGVCMRFFCDRGGRGSNKTRPMQGSESKATHGNAKQDLGDG